MNIGLAYMGQYQPGSKHPRDLETAQKAIEYLEKFVQAFPDDKKAQKAREFLVSMYLATDRYDDAIKWYGEALALAPGNVDVSTDLGVCYYYTNQPDKALQQFEHSLKLDPKHAKTLLNVGIVRAFGKQDLDGALKVWQQVVQIAPASPEGQAAQRAIDSVRASHPGAGSATPNPGT